MTCDFRAPGWLARHPMVGVLMVIIGGLIFGTLAFEVRTHGALLQGDAPLAASLHAMATQASPNFNETMTFGFFVGKELTEIIGVLLVLYFLHKRFWPELGMVVIG